MSEHEDALPPRLVASGSAAQRDLLVAAKLEAPRAGSRAAGIQSVLEQRARQRVGARRLYATAFGVLAVAAAAALFWRARVPAPPSVAFEPRPSAASLHPVPSSSPVDPFAPCSPVTVAAGKEPLIDDFEDGDGQVPWIERRGGFWVVFNDGTGVQKPRPGTQFLPEKIPGGRGQSLRGAHTSGTKFSDWGAVVSTELSPRRCYDASVYAGIQFWARGRGQVRVAVMMTQLVSEKYGGGCAGECLGAHIVNVELQKGWTLYRVRWEDLIQAGPGPKLDFDPHSLFSVSFTARPDQTPFDYWLDDLSFIQR
jgi:hypothetical protein